jgi:uncharacterized protein
MFTTPGMIQWANAKNLSRWLEFTVLFCALPLMAIVFREQTITLLIPALFVIAGFCIWKLVKDVDFKRKRLGRLSDLSKFKRHIHLGFTAWSLVVVGLSWLLLPELFLSLPLQQPYMWFSTIFVYPILSVIPQELIFRTYFFHRYKKLFPGKMLRIVVSAFCFALAHAFYGNWVAVVVAAIGGLLFGLTYALTKSTLIVVIQHSAWGLLLFTVGIGNYFNSAMVGN